LSKSDETAYIRNLRSYSDGKTYLNLKALLECRLETLKESLLTAVEADVKTIQGQAKEINYLLKRLTREPRTQHHTGAFN